MNGQCPFADSVNGRRSFAGLGEHTASVRRAPVNGVASVHGSRVKRQRPFAGLGGEGAVTQPSRSTFLVRPARKSDSATLVAECIARTPALE